jgi:hypothetical protein
MVSPTPVPVDFVEKKGSKIRSLSFPSIPVPASSIIITSTGVAGADPRLNCRGDALLDAIPGVGSALATALLASVADPKAFRSGLDFSAWIGLVLKQNSRGSKDKLGQQASKQLLSAQLAHGRSHSP